MKAKQKTSASCGSDSQKAGGGPLAYAASEVAVVREGPSGASLIAIVPALIGMIAGQRIRRYLSIATFRFCLFALLLILGLQLAVRNLF